MKLASGLWRCKAASCGEKGNLYLLKAKLGDAVEIHSNKSVKVQAARMFKTFNSPTDRMVECLWESPEAVAAKEYIQGRCINHRILRLCRIGWAPRLMSDRGPARVEGHGLIAIPYFEGRDSELPYNGKLRWIPPEPKRDGKPWRYTKFKAGELGLYTPLGLDLNVPVLLVGGEIDTLSIVHLGLEVDGFVDAAKDADMSPCEMLGFCPVGIPNGEGSWSDVWSDLLEGAEDIVIAFDADKAGHRGAEAVASRLGSWRTRIAPEWPGLDPNECLQKGTLTLDVVRDLIDRAKSKASKVIHVARDLADSVVSERMDPITEGWSTGFSNVDRLIGNLRPWEMSIWTGHTGSGKTTFCVQVLDHAACKLGLKVLMCPFEGGKNAGVSRMAHIHHGEPLPMFIKNDTPDTVKAKRQKGLDMIGSLGSGVYMMGHMGVIEPEVWKETLHYCLSRLGVNLVLVDLLNKMVKRDRNRWDAQSQIVSDTQTMIADRSIGAAHLMMVAHPATNQDKRTSNRDNFVMTLADLKGQSDMVQDVETVAQIFRPRTKMRDCMVDEETGLNLASLIILKNGRHGRGGEGKVELRHHPKTHRFSDLSLEETEYGYQETDSKENTGGYFSRTPEKESNRKGENNQLALTLE
jgi:replicative DNA helicase